MPTTSLGRATWFCEAIGSDAKKERKKIEMFTIFLLFITFQNIKMDNPNNYYRTHKSREILRIAI